MKNIFIFFLFTYISCSPICNKDIEGTLWVPDGVKLNEEHCESVKISNNYLCVLSLSGLTPEKEWEFIERNKFVNKKYYNSTLSGFSENFVKEVIPDELFFKSIHSDGKHRLYNYSNGYLFVSRSVAIM